MALTQYVYAEYDADWFATAFARIEKTALGLIALSLTNYDTTSLPAIASGSVVEINGAVGRAASEQAISGSASGGVLNYIYIDASTWVATWTVSAPTWDTAKQGYYSGNNRYVGGCWYDGASYTAKWVYGNVRTLIDASGKIVLVETVKDQGGIATNGLKCKILTIGDWNMDTTSPIGVVHGITESKIRGIETIIRSDSDTTVTYSPLNIISGGSINLSPTNATLSRVASGVFDSANFDQTSYNRGWITLWYEA